MKERWVTLLLAAGALAIFYALFFPKPRDRPLLDGLPLSTDGRADGYLAIWQWLGKEHIPRVSLRLRYDRLAGLLPQPSGNVLLVTLPQRLMTHAAELQALEAWVSRGNTLLIVAALEDEPAWALATSDPLMTQRLQRLTGLAFTAPSHGTSLTAALSSDRLLIRPRGAFPMLARVRRISARTFLARSWKVKPAARRLALELAARSDNGQPALWLEHRGAGQILLCAVASPFASAGLPRDDNARLLADILAWSRSSGGAVVFDDAHQGLTAIYDAQAFFADPRLHATLAWIVLLWFIFVIGSQPLRAHRHEWEPLDETAYVEAGARYLAAVVRPAEAAQRLVEDFLESLRARLRRESGGPGGAPDAVWQWLEAQPAVSAADRRELQASYASACAGARVSLTRLQNLLAHLRRSLA
jgi:hypothetical protein